jgi:hypothetical protein
MAEEPLAELKESAATGQIADIFTDLRYSVGVPMVNLIFRHLATVPDCLEWLWGHVGQYYVDGTFARHAAEITRQQPELAVAMTRDDLQQCGVDANARRAIQITCATYARANPINLIALRTVELMLDDAGRAPDPPHSKSLHATSPHATSPQAAPPRATPVALAALPPMGDLEHLPRATMDKLRALAIQIHGADGPVIPSFFRHFTQWPDFLRLLHDRLSPVMPALNATTLDFENAARNSAASVWRDIPRPASAPTEAAEEALRAVIARFPPNLCKMTLFPNALNAALNAAA